MLLLRLDFGVNLEAIISFFCATYGILQILLLLSMGP